MTESGTQSTPHPTHTAASASPSTETHTVTPTTDCIRSGGSLESDYFFSENLQADFHYQIYLPPCYFQHPDQRFPVVYLLHGLSYNSDQWLRFGLVETMDRLIAEGEIAPYIIVLPQEARFIAPQTSPFPDALVLELIPWIDEQYQTLAEKQNRGIGGVSRGAAWAVRIGFNYYETFSSVGAHSLPLFEADGGNINTWLIKLPKEDLPVFFIDIGRNDQEWKTAQIFADQLDAHNIPHEWYLFKNGHTESYWISHLELYLRWYARDW